MVEFAINNLVHASTTHTPFYVNGLRHPRIPTVLESTSTFRGGRTHLSANQSGSRSSSIDEDVNANELVDSDVDNIDITTTDDSESLHRISGGSSETKRQQKWKGKHSFI